MGSVKYTLAIVALGFATLTHAEPKENEQKKDLQKVQAAISETTQEVKSKKEEYSKIAEQIRATDKELAKQKAKLAAIQQEKRIAVKELEQLQFEVMALKTRIDGTRANLSRLLHSQYRNKQPEALILMLQKEDPNNKGRKLQYLRYIQDANKKVINELTEQQNILETQEVEITAQIEKIKDLISEQQKIVNQLNAKRQKQLRAVGEIDNDIELNKKKIKALKHDEIHLSNLVKHLSHQKAKSKAKAEAVLNNKPVAENKNKQPETIKEQTLPEQNEFLVKTSFARLQGKLNLPVNGKITGKFGDTKKSGTGVYNGLYISTPDASVQSVAAGKIAYARELKGYGKTIIIDHDSSYLTIYSGLSSILVSENEFIDARQAIGVSGSLPNEDNGLYFEIRYHTRPLNPQTWFK